jgi:hypothetical protein
LYFNRVSSSTESHNQDVERPNPCNSTRPLRSILKKSSTRTAAAEYGAEPAIAADNATAPPRSSSSDADDQKDQYLYSVAAPKISTVLLRLVEAEEQLLSIRKQHDSPTRPVSFH